MTSEAARVLRRPASQWVLAMEVTQRMKELAALLMAERASRDTRLPLLPWRSAGSCVREGGGGESGWGRSWPLGLKLFVYMAAPDATATRLMLPRQR